MVLTDHINFMGANTGLRPSARRCLVAGFWTETHLLPRFVDMTQVYDGLNALLLKAARAGKMKLRQYLAVCGAELRDPAEIRAFARLGADAVGGTPCRRRSVARRDAV